MPDLPTHSRPCPECGLPAGSHPSYKRAPLTTFFLTALLLAVAAALSVRSRQSTSQHIPQSFNSITPAPAITGRYLRDLVALRADPHSLRAAVLQMLDTPSWGLPTKGDCLVASAGPPRSSLITRHRIGWPWSWYESNHSTGYENINARAGPYLDGGSYTHPDYIDRWRFNWCTLYADRMSIQDSVTHVRQFFAFSALLGYATAAALLIAPLRAARRQRQRTRSILTGLALIAILASAAAPTQETSIRDYGRANLQENSPYFVTFDSDHLIAAPITDLPRSRAAELVRTDDGVRQLADLLYHGLTGHIEDDWLLRAGFNTSTDHTWNYNTWCLPLCAYPVIVLESVIATDPTVAEHRTGVRFTASLDQLRITTQAPGRRDNVLVFLAPIIGFILLTLCLARAFTAARRRFFARRCRCRIADSRCAGCSYSLA